MEETPQSQRDIDHGKLNKIQTRYPTLVPLGYTPNELANALGRNSKQRRLTSLQKEALADLRSMAPVDPIT